MAVQPALLRQTLPNELVTLVRNMIFEGRLRPGSRIPESRLCDDFRVSRTPLREALRVLACEGLVSLLPNKGARVVRVARKELEEIVPVLGALAALAGELACANARTDQIAQIRCLHTQMVERYRADDKQSYGDLSGSIHEAVFAVAGSKTLHETYNMVQTRLGGLHFFTPKVPPRWADAVADHEEMMAALEAKDSARFAGASRRHTCHKLDMLCVALDMLARADTQHSGIGHPIV
jgi:DNA-binding GntR family transcriptional regulator